MRIIDVSLPIGHELLTWPGDPSVSIEPASRISKGDSANVSTLRFGNHTGTHVDPPIHFIDGAGTVDEMPLGTLIGEAVVADLTKVDEEITADVLESASVPEGTTRLIFKTRNSDLWSRLPIEFPDQYVHLTPDGARWVIERGIRLIGTDFLSIERRGSPGHPTHVALLSAQVVIVEGLDLREVNPGIHRFICLPLKIVDGDGAPARAVLIED